MFCCWYKGDKCTFADTGLLFFPECADTSCIGADNCRHYAVTQQDAEQVIEIEKTIQERGKHR